MGLIRTFLESRWTWALLFLAMLPSAARFAHRGLLRDPRFLATPLRLSLTPADAAGRELAYRLAGRLRALGPVHLFDPRFELKIREALLDDPGVAAVAAVERLWPRGYAATVRLHRPYAVVATPGGVVPVSARAIALPAEGYRDRLDRLFRIDGIEAPPPPPGTFWGDAALFEGLRALRQLAPHLEDVTDLGLFAVDVAGATDAPRGVV
ncbi:MAG: hypothetical protein ACE5JG_11360, partial [Planctomycetota bacterium]